MIKTASVAEIFLLAKGRGLNKQKKNARYFPAEKKWRVICLCSVTRPEKDIFYFLQIQLAEPHATSAQNCSIDGEAEASGNLSTRANYGAKKKKKARVDGWAEVCWRSNKSNNVIWAKKKNVSTSTEYPTC